MRVLENHDQLPPICQINVEVHYQPNWKVNKDFYEEFVEFFPEFIQAGRYVLLNAELTSHPILQHLRFYFFNVYDDKCISKFIC